MLPQRGAAPCTQMLQNRCEGSAMKAVVPSMQLRALLCACRIKKKAYVHLKRLADSMQRR